MSVLSNTKDLEPLDNEYEDLLGQWSDLESALSMLLARPVQALGFTAKVHQCDRWLRDLVAHDIDAALYLMFQHAASSASSFVGYSAAHALVCATLCHILAHRLALLPHERDSLVRAAFTMNIGMTALQDELAVQREPLTREQKQAVALHPRAGLEILKQLEVTDALWLDIVAHHHTLPPAGAPLASLPAHKRLIRILCSIDRYAAMISPRKSRDGKSASDSVRSLSAEGENGSGENDEVSNALISTVGLCPPGTFVRLNNGETAVVLRRSEKPNFPLIASLLDAKGELLNSPMLYHTIRGRPRIEAALARAAVSETLIHRMMVRIGLFAAQRIKTLSPV